MSDAIEVLEIGDCDKFRERVNSLLTSGYSILSTNCHFSDYGSAYQAILLYSEPEVKAPDSEDLPEWLKHAIEIIRLDQWNAKYMDWEFAIYSNSEQFYLMQKEIDAVLCRILSLKPPAKQEVKS